MKKLKEELVEPLRVFWNEVIDEGVLGFDTETHRVARHGNLAAFLEVCGSLRDKVRVVASALSLGYPHAARLDERWISFRMFQAMLLQGLVFCRRHKSPKRSPITNQNRA